MSALPSNAPAGPACRAAGERQRVLGAADGGRGLRVDSRRDCVRGPPSIQWHAVDGERLVSAWECAGKRGGSARESECVPTPSHTLSALCGGGGRPPLSLSSTSSGDAAVAIKPQAAKTHTPARLSRTTRVGLCPPTRRVRFVRLRSRGERGRSLRFFFPHLPPSASTFLWLSRLSFPGHPQSRMGGTLSVVADVFLQVRGRHAPDANPNEGHATFFCGHAAKKVADAALAALSLAHALPNPLPPSMPSPKTKQRPWLRHVPDLDACCGPVAGLTCIVTGPTR
jgi:hypothetical protein